MRWLGLRLSLFVLAFGTGALAAPRQIRLSLDDEPSSLPAVAAPSHAAFPPTGDRAPLPSRRLIRLSLEDGKATYGHLGEPGRLAVPGRHIRTTLD